MTGTKRYWSTSAAQVKFFLADIPLMPNFYLTQILIFLVLPTYTAANAKEHLEGLQKQLADIQGMSSSVHYSALVSF